MPSACMLAARPFAATAAACTCQALTAACRPRPLTHVTDQPAQPTPESGCRRLPSAPLLQRGGRGAQLYEHPSDQPAQPGVHGAAAAHGAGAWGAACWLCMLSFVVWGAQQLDLLGSNRQLAMQQLALAHPPARRICVPCLPRCLQRWEACPGGLLSKQFNHSSHLPAPLPAALGGVPQLAARNRGADCRTPGHSGGLEAAKNGCPDYTCMF